MSENPGPLIAWLVVMVRGYQQEPAYQHPDGDGQAGQVRLRHHEQRFNWLSSDQQRREVCS
ncbi:MAG: hypothetical protein ACR2OU_12465 [Thermomicrobiales bacterium]